MTGRFGRPGRGSAAAQSAEPSAPAAQKPKRLRAAGMVCKIVLAVLAGFFLVYNVYMFAARLSGEPMPRFLRLASAVVVSGSMEPQIGVGDLIVTAARGEYETGDVITYIGPDGVSTTHRVVAKEGARYVVQGDANGAPDPFRPAAEDIVGKVVLVLPGLGRAAAFLQTPFGIFLIAGAAAVLWLLIDLFVSPRRRAA